MIIADTGLFVALFNEADKYHLRALSILDDIEEPLITTWPVITKTSHIILKRVGMKPLSAFMQQISDNVIHVFDIPRGSYTQIPKLLEKYADLPMDLADASLVILAEYLGEGRILSTDQRDFRSYRWKTRKPFKNLMLP